MEDEVKEMAGRDIQVSTLFKLYEYKFSLQSKRLIH